MCQCRILGAVGERHFLLPRALPGRASAQQSPFLKDDVYRALVNEVSGDIAFEHVRWFTHYHRPMGGGEGFEAVARYVEQKAKEYGLEDVRTIKLPIDHAELDARTSASCG